MFKSRMARIHVQLLKKCEISIIGLSFSSLSELNKRRLELIW